MRQILLLQMMEWKNFRNSRVCILIKGLLGAVLIFAGHTAFGQTLPALVKDIRPGVTSEGSSPSLFRPVGDTLYFSAADHLHGRELWASDGTTSGTRLVRDLFPGDSNANPGSLVAMEGSLYFIARDGVHGNELWMTDGTVEGTNMVKDIRSGPDHAFADGAINSLVGINGSLYFSANDGAFQGALWKSDGTASGTLRIKPASLSPSGMTELAGTIYFASNGDSLWKTDGTDEGTTLVKTVRTLGGRIEQITSINGKLLFHANDPAAGQEPYISDGSPTGTMLLKDIRPGLDASMGTFFTGYTPILPLNGSAFFFANDGAHGAELWKTDATADGTQMVHDIRPAPGANSVAFPGVLVELSNRLIFQAINPDEIWSSDGSASGTVRVAPGKMHSPLVVGPHLYYFSDTVEGVALCRTDGTSSGTEVVRNIPDPVPGLKLYPEEMKLGALNNILFFNAADSVWGNELWISQGTEESTRPFKDIFRRPSDSEPIYLTKVGNQLFFGANDGTHGTELWRTDGSEEGTRMIRDIAEGSDDSLIAPVLTKNNYYSPVADGNPLSDFIRKRYRFIENNGICYLRAENSQYGSELWRSDGTASGTWMVCDIREGILGSSPQFLTAHSGSTMFYARKTDPPDASATNLWISEGTEPNTREAGSSFVVSDEGLVFDHTDFVSMGSQFYFTAKDTAHGTELWKYDGATAAMVRDINTAQAQGGGSRGSGVRCLTPFGSWLYFFAVDAESGYGLWRSNGTESATALVKALEPMVSDPDAFTRNGPTYLIAGRDRLYFAHRTEEAVLNPIYQLWASDGTPGGTQAIRPFAFISGMAIHQGVLYFAAREGGGDSVDLWKSDGTTTGTRRVCIANPTGDSSVSDLCVSGPILYFAATDGVSGKELCRVSGPDDEFFLYDIELGSSGSNPRHLIDVNGTLYFSAQVGECGRELFRLKSGFPRASSETQWQEYR